MLDITRIELHMRNIGISTVKEFEKQCGIANGTISKWRHGAYKPSLEYTERIAIFLQVSVDYLLGRTDNPEVNK